MLGLAALVNLLLWPVLIRLGVFSGIRRELLIPVTLVSQPAPTKAPDTLAKVPKPTRVASRPPPHRVLMAAAPVKRPAVPSKTPPVLVASAAPARHAPGPPTPVAVKKPPLKAAQAASLVTNTKARPLLPAVHIAAAHPVIPSKRARPVVVAKFAPTASPRRPAQNSLSAVVAARRERAARLEREGHQFAEQIAAGRAAWLARHRPVAAVPTKPPVPAKTPPEKMAVAPPPVPSPPPNTAPVAPGETDTASVVPAVVLVQVQPTVPESMQDSAWQATFHGMFVVEKDGSFTVHMTSSTGFPVLDKRALAAARKWKFRPATQDGLPVPSHVQFEIDYAVNNVP